MLKFKMRNPFSRCEEQHKLKKSPPLLEFEPDSVQGWPLST